MNYRTITTTGEVLGLRRTTVFRDTNGFVYERGTKRDDTERMGDEFPAFLEDIEFPATVLWEPPA